MDLEGIAKIILAAKELLPALGSAWKGEPESDPGQTKIKEITTLNYPELRPEIDDGSMRIMKHLEDGRNCQSRFLLLEVHPRAEALPNSAMAPLLEEFEYRLEFMQSLGMLEKIRGGGYMISHQGQAFMRVSRERKEYANILLQ